MCSRRLRHSPPWRRTLSKMEPAPRVMRIAETAKVFVLEDSPERIAWFRQRIPQAVLASNAEQALALLDDQTFDVCFLDHDLNFSDATFADARPGSGQRVAHYLAKEHFSGIVVIHSVNEAGARAMKSHLPQSHVMPFGTFELENGASSNPYLGTKSELRKEQPCLAATIYAATIAQRVLPGMLCPSAL